MLGVDAVVAVKAEDLDVGLNDLQIQKRKEVETGEKYSNLSFGIDQVKI